MNVLCETKPLKIIIMKVPSAYIRIIYIAIYKDGSRKEVTNNSVTGYWEAVHHLSRHYGINTSRSTVFAEKKEYAPSFFLTHETKENCLAYLNWVLNFPKSERCEFFANELDKNRFITDNPIVDVKLITRRVHH